MPGVLSGREDGRPACCGQPQRTDQELVGQRGMCQGNMVMEKKKVKGMQSKERIKQMKLDENMRGKNRR